MCDVKKRGRRNWLSDDDDKRLNEVGQMNGGRNTHKLVRHQVSSRVRSGEPVADWRVGGRWSRLLWKTPAGWTQVPVSFTDSDRRGAYSAFDAYKTGAIVVNRVCFSPSASRTRRAEIEQQLLHPQTSSSSRPLCNGFCS